MADFHEPSVAGLTSDATDVRESEMPRGILDGVFANTDGDRSIRAWANGTHILSPQNGEGIDVTDLANPQGRYVTDLHTVHLPSAVPAPFSGRRASDMSISDAGANYMKSWEQGPKGGPH